MELRHQRHVVRHARQQRAKHQRGRGAEKRQPNPKRDARNSVNEPADSQYLATGCRGVRRRVCIRWHLGLHGVAKSNFGAPKTMLLELPLSTDCGEKEASLQRSM